MTRRTTLTLIAAGAILIGVALLLLAVPVSRAQDGDEPPPLPSDAYCLLCHSKPDQVWTLRSGEQLSISVDPATLAGSVHGDALEGGALACADCHGDFRFPHPATTVSTAREFRLERYASCSACHQDQYTRAQDSVHGAALRAGRMEAAVCVDCHGSHDIQPPDEPRQRISLTCGRCHGPIFEEYRASVHGAALMGEDNPDAPTCTNCHGVHDIENPTTALFRARSPEGCATCHAKPEIMDKYGISTQVFDTYLTDFHGATVALFEHEQHSPGAATNKAVCFDCHGVHNIRAVSGDSGSEGRAAIRETLLSACQQCHPDATANFPDAWIGHYPATAQDHPGLFTARTVYRWLIPLTIGFAVLVVGSDLFRRIRRRSRGDEGA
ncbi:MAG: cytochrome c3 family protein [Anaerolineae bacterium]|nr:cytochrome c3 family protein [Anaerolineae bacterium]